jgi:hypothetical protein
VNITSSFSQEHVALLVSISLLGSEEALVRGAIDDGGREICRSLPLVPHMISPLDRRTMRRSRKSPHHSAKFHS